MKQDAQRIDIWHTTNLENIYVFMYQEITRCTSMKTVSFNHELIEKHSILPYYDGETICNWKEL